MYGLCSALTCYSNGAKCARISACCPPTAASTAITACGASATTVHKCKQCKVCQAEKACPFYIDIRNQDNEMPATCCLCFSCMEACPFEGVITYTRNPAEKARLKAEAKTGIPDAPKAA